LILAGLLLGSGLVAGFFLGRAVAPSQTVEVGVAPRPPVLPPPLPKPVDPPDALLPVASEREPALLDDLLAIDGGASLRAALEIQLVWLKKAPAERVFTFGRRAVKARDLRVLVEHLLAALAQRPDAAAFAAAVRARADLLEAAGSPTAGGPNSLLVTGYYEPSLHGCLKKSPECQVPLYGPPNIDFKKVDLGAFDEKWRGERIAGELQGERLVPFADRRTLRESGRMRGREIAWARDPVDAFFLEIQGSGALILPDGKEKRIGYAGANGLPYRSLGKVLIEQGKIEKEKVSMQSIRAYLAAHPDERQALLDTNRSVVFFRFLEGAPVGNIGLELTPERSIATDQRFFPPGAVGFLITERPRLDADGRTVVEGPLERFVVNQDTGGAIRGAGRVDFFWGKGVEATERAGAMKQPGRLFFLVPK
jgi:membrane-bound lytic murein transglycosylase A